MNRNDDKKETDEIYKIIKSGVEKNIENDILNKIKIKKLKNIVNEFIKYKKLIIVGDEAIKFYRPNDYKEIELKNLDKIKDLPITISVLSSFAISDAKELGNKLYKEFEHIVIAETEEYKTYNLNVEFKTVVKFSYINGKFYKNIPFIESNGLKYITPEYLLLNIYYNYITPRINVKHWEENIKFEKALFEKELFRTDRLKNKLKPLFYRKDVNNKHYELLDKIYNVFCKNKKDIIITGLYALNNIIKISSSNNNNLIDNISYISILCEDRKKSFKEITSLIGLDGIKKKETQKLLMYLGEGYQIYYKNNLLIKLIEVPTCMSYNTVGDYNISNYHQIIWFIMLQNFYTNNKNVSNNYRKLINFLVNYRINYLDNHKLSGLEKSVFQIFQDNCIGENINYKFKYHMNFWEKKRIYYYKFT